MKPYTHKHQLIQQANAIFTHMGVENCDVSKRPKGGYQVRIHGDPVRAEMTAKEFHQYLNGIGDSDVIKSKWKKRNV